MSSTSRLPLPNTERWDWQLAAACRNVGDGLFFSPEGEPSRSKVRRRREAAAKKICAECPVRLECLHHSLACREPYGIWGGLGETERWELLAQHGVCYRETESDCTVVDNGDFAGIDPRKDLP